MEVLVALLVLSFGLIGLAMLQTTSLRFNNDSYMRTQATFLAYDLIDRMRANKAGVESGDYIASAPPSTSETCGGDSVNGCTDAQSLAKYDITSWYDLQKLYLSPAASASSVTKAASGKYTITMRWNERDTDIEQTWVIEL